MQAVWRLLPKPLTIVRIAEGDHGYRGQAVVDVIPQGLLSTVHHVAIEVVGVVNTISELDRVGSSDHIGAGGVVRVPSGASLPVDQKVADRRIGEAFCSAGGPLDRKQP